MRFLARMGLLATLTCVFGAAAAREPFRIPGGTPTSIREVVDVLRGPIEDGEEPDEDRHLSVYLENAQCGGWDTGLGVEGYVADVRGLPGREHDWDGDVLTGMATRADADGDGNPDNDYAFPDSARGLATACAQKTPNITKTVWAPVRNWVTVDGENVVEYGPGDHVFAHPYFEDPACRWRFEGGAWPAEPLAPDAPIPNSDKNSWETEDEQSCTDLCLYLNSFVYEDCLDVQPRDITVPDGVDAAGDPVEREIRINVCAREGRRYICTDGEVEPDDRAAACFNPHPDVEEWANARMCEGQQCRCPNAEDPAACLTVRDQKNDEKRYQSYYRTYREAGYQRDALHHAPQDVAAQNLQSTCFGFYDEFDPKTHRTEAKDRRCVINIDVRDRFETQKGKALYQEGGVQDRDPTDASRQRPGGEDDAPGAFDDDEDAWYKKLGGAFSLVNERALNERYDGDLAKVYLDVDELDEGRLSATPQINDGQPYAEHSHLRAFDDTGQPRVYSQWWQEQQARMASLLRPPVLRIVLPNAWFMGLDPNDPFIGGSGGEPAGRANRADRIELQIEANEDMLGAAMAFIERSLLLRVEEEPIHVAVPAGSPVEFRARAADWCNWYKSQSGEKTCDGAPQEIKDILTRLEEYAARIDEYRQLRVELAETAGAVLDVQRRMLEPIARWFADHQQQLRNVADSRARVERELLPQWRQIQTGVALLHERTNLPWCMNHRYTAPILTQIDPWLPSRTLPGAPIEMGGLPRLPEISRDPDVIVDFSAVSAMSGVLKIPVLKPVQIRIDVPAPPAVAVLAPLPSVQPIRDAVADALERLPEVRDTFDDAPPFVPPAPIDDGTLTLARNALNGILAVVGEMNARYDRFWKSIGPLKPPKNDEDREEFERQIEFKTQMKCRDFNDLPCDHPEMNLREIVQRIGSRPLVQLAEDFESIGEPRNDPTVCPPEDHACHLLNAERVEPRYRLEVLGSADNDAPIDELRTSILTLTQPPPIGSMDPALVRPHEDNPSPVRGFPDVRLLP